MFRKSFDKKKCYKVDKLIKNKKLAVAEVNTISGNIAKLLLEIRLKTSQKNKIRLVFLSSPCYFFFFLPLPLFDVSASYNGTIFFFWLSCFTLRNKEKLSTEWKGMNKHITIKIKWSFISSWIPTGTTHMNIQPIIIK